jgi:ferredoxin
MDTDGLQELLHRLAGNGYQTIGPVVRNKAIVFGEINFLQDLPSGVRDHYEPGRCALSEESNCRTFNYLLSSQPLKHFFHPPDIVLWRAEKRDTGIDIIKSPATAPRMAFFGIRPCDLAALQVLDSVFDGTRFSEPLFTGRRNASFFVVVNCTRPGELCFCASMGAGPKAESGFDIALTELPNNGPIFVAEPGSEIGLSLIREISPRNASKSETDAALQLTDKAAGLMGRTLDTSRVKSIFKDHLENPHWQHIAKRCLACGNCTMVCPTCFCFTVMDTTDLVGKTAERHRLWDSCFSMEHSYIHGGSIRSSAASRYRQWLTHKLCTWQDQFGVSGCVGCGRCIAFCPVGIDITEEASRLQEKPL